jgi:hypothetical protein
MALKIVKKTDPVKVERLKVLIYGQCGVGKTTLGFTANKPILFNFDDGVKGIINREDYVEIKTWEDVMTVKQEDLLDYDTIVIDTLGSMQEILKVYVKKMQGGKFAQADGNLKIQGWGVLGNMMVDFFNLINSFDKELVVIAHEKIDGEADEKMIDIAANGLIKDKIKNVVDLTGYIKIWGNKRIISFEPTDTNRCKNRGGLAPQIEIGDAIKEPNTLANIIQNSKDYINTKSESEVAFQARLTEVMAEIDACGDIESYQLPEDVKHDAMLKKHLQNKLDEIVMVDFRKALENANDAVAVNMMVDFYKEFIKINKKAREEFNAKVNIKYVYDTTKKQYVEKVKQVEGANE